MTTERDPRNLPKGMERALVAMALLESPDERPKHGSPRPELKKGCVDQRRKARRKTAKASRRRNRK